MGYPFGAGSLWATPTTGAAGTNQPVRFGILQDVSVDFTQTTKKLYGSYRFPVDVAGGTSEVKGKATFAKISGLLYASLFFGVSLSTGQMKTADGESSAIPGTPYTITVTNSSVWGFDLGVVFAATGVALTPVASGPTAGQYSVTNGVYTFAAADTTKVVQISYTYNAASGGFRQTLANSLLGFVPRFQVNLYVNAAGSLTEQFDLQLNQCTPSKLSFATKLEDYMIPNLEFEAFCDASNNLGVLGTAA